MREPSGRRWLLLIGEASGKLSCDSTRIKKLFLLHEIPIEITFRSGETSPKLMSLGYLVRVQDISVHWVCFTAHFRFDIA